MPDREPPVPLLRSPSILVTAEHASNAVPREWQSLFDGHDQVLAGHRGWDPGTSALSERLADALDAPLLTGRWSRLLVDLNRSERHPRRFSEFTRGLADADRRALTDAYWQPHWNAYADALERSAGRLVHLACHSFTPVLDGKRRSTDVGLLHDPSRAAETRFCRELQRALQERLPDAKVHRNQPYRGTSDGIGAWHRRSTGEDRLVTVEIEVNQAWVGGRRWPALKTVVVEAVEQALESIAA
ncbi:MAG: N-formylglutamate amidohydrolase [Wenzhouxiangellaceae bacterium]|nr:N-formylglutamate amidohydrolase [Wenzhouxiangellaceae bacterium]